jgi:hypothetical protein
MWFFGTLNWKSLLVFLAMIATQPISAHSGGGATVGGGDLCEDRIKIIRDDLLKWIHQGGPDALNLPPGVSVKHYRDEMVQAIRKTKIQCVGPRDRGYPVKVDGTPKTCRFDKGANETRITCDVKKFSSLSESDQYVLIHHEYAGLSGIEPPHGDDSRYEVSNQISDFLVDKQVKMLAVKKPRHNPPQPAPLAGCASVNEAVFECTVDITYHYTDLRSLSPVEDWFQTKLTVRASKNDESYCQIWDARNFQNSVPCKTIREPSPTSFSWFTVVLTRDFLAKVLKENIPYSTNGNRVTEILLSSFATSKSKSFKLDFQCRDSWEYDDNCRIPKSSVSDPNSPGEAVTLIFQTSFLGNGF